MCLHIDALHPFLGLGLGMYGVLGLGLAGATCGTEHCSTARKESMLRLLACPRNF